MWIPLVLKPALKPKCNKNGTIKRVKKTQNMSNWEWGKDLGLFILQKKRSKWDVKEGADSVHIVHNSFYFSFPSEKTLVFWQSLFLSQTYTLTSLNFVYGFSNCSCAYGLQISDFSSSDHQDHSLLSFDYLFWTVLNRFQHPPPLNKLILRSI